MDKTRQEKNPVWTAAAMFNSQKEFADKMGVSRQAVCQWIQKGEIPMRKVQKASDLTNIPIWVLNPTLCKKPRSLKLEPNA